VKLISFRRNGKNGYGVVKDGGIVDMTARLGDKYPTLQDAVAALALSDVESASSAAADFSLDDIEYDFPIANPQKIMCVGRNYRAYHEVVESGGPNQYPSIFGRFVSSFSRHNEPILKPKVSDQFDYEGELVAVIGKGGRHIPEDKALEYVGGYTIMNEGSVRDWQQYGTQNCPGKNFYRSGAIGPWMITTDELADLGHTRIVTRVDDEVRQDGTTEMMIFSLPFVIAHVSRFTWLEPGDMIATGSPGGSAIESKPPKWLKAGQTIEVEIPDIGVLHNPIENE
jgi:2-keto-4-pentenoate hydratase/2-oxohepta-3-ene-1,7-dioic acid hydratase in catechol pathway